MNRFLSLPSVNELALAAAGVSQATLVADHAVLYLVDEGRERLVDTASGLSIPLEDPGSAPACVLQRETLVDGPIAATPVLAEGHVVGVLEVSRGRQFDSGDRQALEALADEIAPGLVASQLRDDVNSLLLHCGEWLAAAQEAMAPGGAGHVWRVTHLCTELAECLAFTADDRQRLWLAAQYHDLGWVVGPGALPSTHAALGARALRTVRRLETIADLVEVHHERFDGSGLPAGLCGGALSLEACILTLAEDLDEAAAARTLVTPFAGPDDVAAFVTTFAHLQGQRHHPRVVAALESLLSADRLRPLYC